jgi:hypothetical protein
MSGEQNPGGPKPAQNPFYDETDAPQPRRAKRTKPPPGIISAGGVDMARAHASGIKVREGTAAEPTLDQPRVVVAVETDPRKVPTHRKMIDGRDAGEDGARSAMLPGAGSAPAGRPPPATPVEAAAPAAVAAPRVDPDAETLKRNRQELPAWMRVAAVLVLFLLVAGVVRRVRLAAAVPEQEPIVASTVAARPAPPPTEAAPPSAVPAAVPAPVETAEPTRAAAPRAAASEPEARPAPRPVKAPPPSRPTYTPPFQLPGEKN